MKKKITKESWESVCDLCEKEIDYEDGRRGFVRTSQHDFDVCKDCCESILEPFLESKKLTK